MNLRAALIAFALLSVGCGVKLASPDAHLNSGRDSDLDQSSSFVAPKAEIQARDNTQTDQSTSAVKNLTAEVGGDHSRASGVDSELISGGNVVNFVVQTVEKAPSVLFTVLWVLGVIILTLFGLAMLCFVLWKRLRAASTQLEIVISGVEASEGDAKQKIAAEVARRSKFHRTVQRRTVLSRVSR